MWLEATAIGLPGLGRVVLAGLWYRERPRAGHAEPDEFAAEADVFDDVRHEQIFARRQQNYRILAGDPDSLLERGITTGQLMWDGLTTVRTDTPREELLRLALENKIRHPACRSPTRAAWSACSPRRT